MAFVIREHEPLARHTVFKIGGPARFFVETATGEELVAAIRAAQARSLPWLVLGAGSNVLVADRGFAGTVIHPSGGNIRVEGDRIVADAATPMARVVGEALKAGLRGFEWAIGVPGAIGGSVRGNAGCFGGEMKDVIERIAVFDAARDGVVDFSRAEAEFGYRDSIFKRRPELVILGVTLRLMAGDTQEGQRIVRDFTRRRAETQDIGSQSAGCMFKNIPWGRRDVNAERLVTRFPELADFRASPAIPAGFLIDRLGLKGRRVGAAKISERHGNFIINTGQATAEEVIMLIGIAKEHVHRHYGLLLEEEIQYIGF